MKGTKDGLHVRCNNKRVDNFSVYELWSGDSFVSAAYGPFALATLALIARHISERETFAMKDAFDLVLDEKGEPFMGDDQQA